MSPLTVLGSGCGSGSGGTPNACAPPQDGSRLKAFVLRAEDGAWENLSRYGYWYDSLLATRCFFDHTADGALTLLAEPPAVDSTSQTPPAASASPAPGPARTAPLATRSRPCPRRAREPIRSRRPRSIRSDRAAFPRFFIISKCVGGTLQCLESPNSEGLEVYPFVSELAPTEFVAATIELTTGSRIQTDRLVAEDGARGGAGRAFDSNFGGECLVDLAADGEWRCLPVEAIIRRAGWTFADPSCTQGLVAQGWGLLRAGFPREAREYRGAPDLRGDRRRYEGTLSAKAPRSSARRGEHARPDLHEHVPDRQQRHLPSHAEHRRDAVLGGPGRAPADGVPPREPAGDRVRSHGRKRAAAQGALCGLGRRRRLVGCGDLGRRRAGRGMFLPGGRGRCHPLPPQSPKNGRRPVLRRRELQSGPRRHRSLHRVSARRAQVRGRGRDGRRVRRRDGTGRHPRPRPRARRHRHAEHALQLQLRRPPCVPFDQAALETFVMEFEFRELGSEVPPTTFVAGTIEMPR